MRKNLLALSYGVILSFFLLGVTELIFRFNEVQGYRFWSKPVAAYPKQNFDDEKSEKLHELVKGHKIFSWRPLLSEQEIDELSQATFEKVSTGSALPCCVGRMPPVQNEEFVVSLTDVQSKKIAYQAHYTFDALGRRITPRAKSPHYNILMFGDSFLLGEGVNDEESGPYVLGSLRPDAQVYNFGVAGGSPNEFLYELEQSPSLRLSDIPQKKSIVLYSYMDNHLERLFCRSFCLRPENNWIITKPFYQWEDNKIQLQGFFDSERPVTNYFYKLVNGSSFLNYFGVTLPLYFSQKHFDFFAEIMFAAKSRAEVLYPDSDFFLVLYPGASGVYGPSLRLACEKKGIKVLDYSDLQMKIVTGGWYGLPLDGHPSPITQFVFGTILNRDLPKY